MQRRELNGSENIAQIAQEIQHLSESVTMYEQRIRALEVRKALYEHIITKLDNADEKKLFQDDIDTIDKGISSLGAENDLIKMKLNVLTKIFEQSQKKQIMNTLLQLKSIPDDI